jgi:hypothetical protein
VTTDGVQRGTRAKKEAFILSIVQVEGKIKVTDLYGGFSKRYPGSAIRTFLNEYLPALEYRQDIVLAVESTGYFAYHPPVFEKQQVKEGKITR